MITVSEVENSRKCIIYFLYMKIGFELTDFRHFMKTGLELTDFDEF